jgi:protein associated with RNAse G/E
MNEYVRVQKLDLAGKLMWQYEGRVLRREPNAVVLEAFFNRGDMPIVDTVFKQNDRFIETFYMDRWYNVFEVHDRDDGRLKGWYCNIGRPATVGPDTVSYVDLALDLWVSADGVQTVLDEDEFEALRLGPDERETARAALRELKAAFESKKPPH